MSAFDRPAHCRRIAALGGRRTVERHGTAHMSRIGAIGFQVAVALGWGPQLAAKLAPSYRAKYGRDPILGPACLEKARLRAEARRIYGGMPCDVPGCREPGQVHHLHGLGIADPNAIDHIAILCDVHHRERHRQLRRARRAG